MLAVEHLCCRLGSFELHDISFTLSDGEYLVLLGPSGVGKTVLLELLCGLLHPTSGRIRLDGQDLAHVPIQRRGLGLVYQDHALFPHRCVRDNITYNLPRRTRTAAVSRWAECVGAAHLLDRRPDTLSLGEAQRVALARTLAHRPRILLLDEPLASLDAVARASLRSLLRRLHATGQTLLHVTHDYQEALSLATRVGILENGRLVQIGSPNDIFHHPRSHFVARFIGIQNYFRGTATHHNGISLFETGSLRFHLPAAEASGPGAIVFESDTLTVSRHQPIGSARNLFQGTLLDLEPSPCGVVLCVDVGLQLHALVTHSACNEMNLVSGQPVWLSLKSTAIRFIPDQPTP